MLSQAHTRLSIGASWALQMGLHVKNPACGTQEVDADFAFRRRQVFAVLYAMDTYVSSFLGLPKLLSHADAD